MSLETQIAELKQAIEILTNTIRTLRVEPAPGEQLPTPPPPPPPPTEVAPPVKRRRTKAAMEAARARDNTTEAADEIETLPHTIPLPESYRRIEEAPVEENTTEPVRESAPEPANIPPLEEKSLEECVAMTRKLYEKKGLQATLNVLAQFGTDRASGLSVEHRGPYCLAVQQEIDGVPHT